MSSLTLVCPPETGPVVDMSPPAASEDPGRAIFSEEQDTGILKEGEAGERAADICRRHGSHAHAHYRWKAKYGGMDLDEARRLKARPDENRRQGRTRMIPGPKLGAGQRTTRISARTSAAST